MKKLFAFAVCFTLFVSFAKTANAKIRRVGYFGTPVTNTDYTDLQSAHDAAAAGDTLLIFPGSWNATYNKKIITLGYGYFTDTAALGTQANAGLQNIKGTLNFGVTLAAGSNNSVFEGLDNATIQGDNSGATLTGIIVRRCHGAVVLYQTNTYTNWQISQCYLENLYLSVYGNATINSITVNNCYIYAIYGGNGTVGQQSGQFTNNTINYADFDNGGYMVKNNIIMFYHYKDANVVYQNNLFNTSYGAVTGSGNVNVDYTTMSNNVFVGYGDQGTYSNDARWALQAASPAKGIGAGGVDAGMYGSTNPYKLSGIPRIPAFYKLTASSNTTSSNPYTVTFSVRSNN